MKAVSECAKLLLNMHLAVNYLDCEENGQAEKHLNATMEIYTALPEDKQKRFLLVK